MSGRHRRIKGFRVTGAIAMVMVLAVVVAGAWFGYQRLAGSVCSGQTRLNVAAAPEIAPAVRAVATDWVQSGAAVGGRCVAVRVTATDPAEVAAVVANQHGVSLGGIGQASGTAEAPDVWLADSSTWLGRLRSASSRFVPTNNASVARSPVVVAMPEPVAAKVGWPDEKLNWAGLLKRITSDTGLRVGTVEPARDAPSLSALLAFGGAAGKSGGNYQQVVTAVLRALATGKSALRQDLLARFPRSADPASLASGLGAAAMSEMDVIAYNAQKPPVKLAALYLDPAPMALDYPYAIMPGIGRAKAQAAASLFELLGSDAFHDLLGRQGLRTPDGKWTGGYIALRGAPSMAEQPAASAAPSAGAAEGPDPTLVNRLLATWTAVTLPARMLALIDVSGSMREAVPTAGNATRMQVTLDAAQRGLALFDDSSAIGLWTFSTELVGGRDYRELVPIGPLSSQRSRLGEALRGIEPKPSGRTGLYDSLLAAYGAVQAKWAPGKVNSVVVLTDGENDDANGISHEKLLAELKRRSDPARPIQVIVVGIGNEVGGPELTAITKVTGGGIFVTEDPAKAEEIFLQAISMRPAAVQ